MAAKPAISIVVPVYDEVENLPHLHRAIADAMELAGVPFELLLIDDGSADGSGEEADRLAALDPRVRVVHFVRNYGQTAAMSAGFRLARHDVLVSIDADLQNDPADIPMMLGKLDDGYDLVCGWRRSRQDRFLDRKLPSILANRLISRVSKVPLHDYGCTLKVYRREFLQDIPLYGQMHRFIPIYVTWAGARLVEVPVRHHPRTRGTSKYGLGRVFRVLLDLLTVKFIRDFYVNPIYFFGYAGFASIFAGFVAVGGALWMKAAYGTWMHKNPLVVLAGVLVLLGFNSFFFGLIAEVMIRMSFEIQGKQPYRIRSVVSATAVADLPPGVPVRAPRARGAAALALADGGEPEADGGSEGR